MDVGGGETRNVVFHSHSQRVLDFPLTVTYNVTDDPNRVVLNDLLARCGIVGGQKTQLVVKYKITVSS